MLATELFKTASLMALEASFQSRISTAICRARGKVSSSFGMVAYSQARCVFKITVKLLHIFLKTSKMTSSFKNNAAFVGSVRLKEKEQTGHWKLGSVCLGDWGPATLYTTFSLSYHNYTMWKKQRAPRGPLKGHCSRCRALICTLLRVNPKPEETVICSLYDI